MGREIRRVPPDWQHPQTQQLRYFAGQYEPVWAEKPLLDKSLREAQEEWDRGKAEFEEADRAAERWTEADEQWARERYSNDGSIKAGELKYPNGFADYEGLRPPEWDDDGVTRIADWYRPDWPEETRTAFQVYETVSEGTPCSPVFATADELIAWLADPSREDDRLSHMSEEAARRFVEAGSVPSLMVRPGVGMASNVEMLEPEFDDR